MQANAYAQQNIQSDQQHTLQQSNPSQQNNIPNQQALQAQVMRIQLQQMQAYNQQVPQGQQNQGQQGNPQMMHQQQEILMTPVQANNRQLCYSHLIIISPRQFHLYQQQLIRLRREIAQRFMYQYRTPNQYPPNIAH